MTFLNEVTTRYPDATSFAPGRPYDGLLAGHDVNGYLDRYREHLAAGGLGPEEVAQQLLQYGPTAGTIRDLVAAMLRRDEGIDARPDDVVITTGCQEALIVTLRALFRDQNDVLLVPTPSYTGVTGAALLLDITVRTVADGPAGVDPSAVRAGLAALRAEGRRPRALYLIPEAANPSGASLSIEVRRELLHIAEEFDILLLEDHAYAVFAPIGAAPSLKALDRARRVVHLGTFAKAGFPGLRIGYLVADQPVGWTGGGSRNLASVITDVKSMVTVNTSPICQAIAGGLLLSHELSLRAANVAAAEYYRTNLALARKIMSERFDGTGLPVSWNNPSGGFFMVVTVGFDVDDDALEQCARDHAVVWTPMRYFQHTGGERQLRLSLSYVSPQQVRDGMGRLADFITARCPQPLAV
ncbi:aminotransferase-like domain-containing protein [Streptomyces chartreusis]|uniref:aminotransferase-like domain-containing protein n=1 Tax=Streptomyces chartreusis TaxID=1969 RepID=UPI0036CAFEC8